jgi:hypothetical protein
MPGVGQDALAREGVQHSGEILMPANARNQPVGREHIVDLASLAYGLARRHDGRVRHENRLKK